MSRLSPIGKIGENISSQQVAYGKIGAYKTRGDVRNAQLRQAQLRQQREQEELAREKYYQDLAKEYKLTTQELEQIKTMESSEEIQTFIQSKVEARARNDWLNEQVAVKGIYGTKYFSRRDLQKAYDAVNRKLQGKRISLVDSPGASAAYKFLREQNPEVKSAFRGQVFDLARTGGYKPEDLESGKVKITMDPAKIDLPTQKQADLYFKQTQPKTELRYFGGKGRNVIVGPPAIKETPPKTELRYYGGRGRNVPVDLVEKEQTIDLPATIIDTPEKAAVYRRKLEQEKIERGEFESKLFAETPFGNIYWKPDKIKQEVGKGIDWITEKTYPITYPILEKSKVILGAKPYYPTKSYFIPDSGALFKQSDLTLAQQLSYVEKSGKYFEQKVGAGTEFVYEGTIGKLPEEWQPSFLGKKITGEGVGKVTSFVAGITTYAIPGYGAMRILTSPASYADKYYNPPVEETFEKWSKEYSQTTPEEGYRLLTKEEQELEIKPQIEASLKKSAALGFLLSSSIAATYGAAKTISFLKQPIITKGAVPQGKSYFALEKVQPLKGGKFASEFSITTKVPARFGKIQPRYQSLFNKLLGRNARIFGRPASIIQLTKPRTYVTRTLYPITATKKGLVDPGYLLMKRGGAKQATLLKLRASSKQFGLSDFSKLSTRDKYIFKGIMEKQLGFKISKSQVKSLLSKEGAGDRFIISDSFLKKLAKVKLTGKRIDIKGFKFGSKTIFPSRVGTKVQGVKKFMGRDLNEEFSKRFLFSQTGAKQKDFLKLYTPDRAAGKIFDIRGFTFIRKPLQEPSTVNFIKKFTSSQPKGFIVTDISGKTATKTIPKIVPTKIVQIGTTKSGQVLVQDVAKKIATTQAKDIIPVASQVNVASVIPKQVVKIPAVVAKEKAALIALDRTATFTGAVALQNIKVKSDVKLEYKQVGVAREELVSKPMIKALTKPAQAQVSKTISKVAPKTEVIEVLPPPTTPYTPFNIPRQPPELKERTLFIPLPFLKPKVYKSPFKKGFDVFAKTKGKFIKLNLTPLTRGGALSLGAKATEESLARTFKIRPTTSPARYTKGSGNYWERVSKQFRPYRISKGKRVPLTETFIEKTSFAISTPGEKKGLSLARWFSNRRKIKRRKKSGKKKK